MSASASPWRTRMTFTRRRLADLRPGVVAVLGLLCACARPQADAVSIRDAGQLVGHRTDAEPLVTPRSVEGWLTWQRAVAALDAGVVTARARAVTEAALMRDAGLDDAQVEAVEAVVAAVVTERTLSSITGTQALDAFRDNLASLGPEQRAKAMAALEAMNPGRSSDAGFASLEGQFGGVAVQAVRAREAEVGAAWEALLQRR